MGLPVLYATEGRQSTLFLSGLIAFKIAPQGRTPTLAALVDEPISTTWSSWDWKPRTGTEEKSQTLRILVGGTVLISLSSSNPRNILALPDVCNSERTILSADVGGLEVKV